MGRVVLPNPNPQSELRTSTFLLYFVCFLKGEKKKKKKKIMKNIFLEEKTAVRFFLQKYVFHNFNFFFFFFLQRESSTLHTLFMLGKLGHSF